MSSLPPALQAIIEDFALCEGPEKLELLLQYANELPPLPDHLRDHRDRMAPVPECMTPVFAYAELRSGKMYFVLDVPEESPTVRGFACLLMRGLNGCTPADVLAVPNDFHYQMGLGGVLTGQRLNGLRAILARLKQFAHTLPAQA